MYIKNSNLFHCFIHLFSRTEVRGERGGGLTSDGAPWVSCLLYPQLLRSSSSRHHLDQLLGSCISCCCPRLPVLLEKNLSLHSILLSKYRDKVNHRIEVLPSVTLIIPLAFNLCSQLWNSTERYDKPKSQLRRSNADWCFPKHLGVKNTSAVLSRYNTLLKINPEVASEP